MSIFLEKWLAELLCVATDTLAFAPTERADCISQEFMWEACDHTRSKVGGM